MMRRKSEYAATEQQPVAATSAATPIPVSPVATDTQAPRQGFTGTTCPVCNLAQWYIVGGVTCPKGHCYTSVEASKAKKPYQTLEEFAARRPPEPEPEPVAAPAPMAPVVVAPPPVQPPPAMQPPPAVEITEPPHATTTRRRKPSTVDTVPAPTAAAPPPPPPPVATPIDAASQVESMVLGEGYERIIERVFTINPFESYERLEHELKLPTPAHQADYGCLIDALDNCEDNAREAHRLFVSSKVVVDRYDADGLVLVTDMRTQAVAALQGEKERGERTKQITDADVESRIALMFPDEWRAVSEKRAKARRMVAHLERLADVWRDRARDVRAMLETSRR